jgi:hypothetical protein
MIMEMTLLGHIIHEVEVSAEEAYLDEIRSIRDASDSSIPFHRVIWHWFCHFCEHLCGR